MRHHTEVWEINVGAAVRPGDEVELAACECVFETRDRLVADVRQVVGHRKIEITSDNGMRLREFQNRSGVVFAVVWSGPAMPDLQQLLGASYQTYTTALAAANHPGLKRPLRIATPNLVVESEGHMRAFSGRAYLPALIPAGTSAADLR